jgi:hypothetical protein
VAEEEIGTSKAELLETAEFVKLRSEGGHQLLVVVWRYIFNTQI